MRLVSVEIKDVWSSCAKDQRIAKSIDPSLLAFQLNVHQLVPLHKLWIHTISKQCSNCPRHDLHVLSSIEKKMQLICFLRRCIEYTIESWLERYAHTIGFSILEPLLCQ
jgi:hypothetical protein